MQVLKPKPYDTSNQRAHARTDHSAGSPGGLALDFLFGRGSCSRLAAAILGCGMNKLHPNQISDVWQAHHMQDSIV